MSDTLWRLVHIVTTVLGGCLCKSCQHLKTLPRRFPSNLPNDPKGMAPLLYTTSSTNHLNLLRLVEQLPARQFIPLQHKRMPHDGSSAQGVTTYTLP